LINNNLFIVLPGIWIYKED